MSMILYVIGDLAINALSESTHLQTSCGQIVYKKDCCKISSRTLFPLLAKPDN